MEASLIRSNFWDSSESKGNQCVLGCSNWIGVWRFGAVKSGVLTPGFDSTLVIFLGYIDIACLKSLNSRP
ncbi:hypothetical protein QQP08_011673 [Theobroma cacao]|nr:hypothetical protein QQP08_011673 [Theobroma cacao]